MKRIFTLLCNQFMGFDTHQHIGGFDTYHKLVISHLFDHMHFIHSTFYQPFRCNFTVFFYQFFFQRATVNTYTDRHPIFFCFVYNRLHTFSASDVARINADLICAIFYCGNCQTIIKMNICHQRNMYLLFYTSKCLCRLHGRYCAANDLTAGFFKRQDLCHCSFHIFCLCICHRLNRNLIPAPDCYISDLNLLCLLSEHTLSPFFIHMDCLFLHNQTPSTSDVYRGGTLLFFCKYHLLTIFSLRKRQLFFIHAVGKSSGKRIHYRF